MPIVAPQYGISPERKRLREQHADPATGDHPAHTPEARAGDERRPQFWYPRDLAMPEENINAPAKTDDREHSARKVTVEVRKRRTIQK